MKYIEFHDVSIVRIEETDFDDAGYNAGFKISVITGAGTLYEYVIEKECYPNPPEIEPALS